MTTRKTGLAEYSELLAVNLWDEAYRDLKSQESDQLKRYEDTIKLWLEGNSGNCMLHQLLVGRPLGDGLQADPPQWKQQISGIVAACLSMNPDDDGPTKTTDEKDMEPESQPRVHSILQPTRHSVPHSVLPWAGMWLCLQVRKSYV
jgi:hypothetical protein